MSVISILADISAVLVILEFMLLAAIPLAVLVLAVRGMRWLNTNLRPWLQQVQNGVNNVRDAVKRGAQAVSKPFVAFTVYLAQAQGFFRGIGKTFGK